MEDKKLDNGVESAIAPRMMITMHGVGETKLDENARLVSRKRREKNAACKFLGNLGKTITGKKLRRIAKTARRQERERVPVECTAAVLLINQLTLTASIADGRLWNEFFNSTNNCRG
jgi:hypothetical protein